MLVPRHNHSIKAGAVSAFPVSVLEDWEVVSGLQDLLQMPEPGLNRSVVAWEATGAWVVVLDLQDHKQR